MTTSNPSPTPIESLWTVKQLQQFLNISRTAAYDLIHRGSLPHVMLGSRYRFEPAEVRAWVARNRSTAPNATVLPIARAAR